jgi:bifunctional UDP-N-acetylglucosamine pyrophosphorylase/glucosamine-1-phosphate N-acetyltransferase
LVVGRQAEQIEAALAHRGVQFVFQADQRGTGHALAACRERIGSAEGHLLVLLGDCPLLSAGTLRRLVATQGERKTAATVITTQLEDPAGYGRVLRDEDGHVRAIVEQKAATPGQLAVHEINSGIYCFRNELLWKYLDHIRPNNPVHEYYLTDIVEIFRGAGYAVVPMLLEDPSDVLGTNTRAELAGVDRVFRERKTRQLMLEGVTIEKPETVTIDMGVEIGMDTIVEPFTRILGRTVIGQDCLIRACSIVRDSELSDQVEVGPFTLIENSKIDAGARVGPFARLRMQTHIEGGAQVGNFVEIKKTRLGPKSKAMHLAYLGDTTTGEGVNVGAGMIVCNYDGAEKHPATIGDGAFIGSNATLVAPVEIGPGSYVAAGSTITENVPAGALGIGRARQVVKEGWTNKRKKSAPATAPTSGNGTAN